jgi:hypothetical protein
LRPQRQGVTFAIPKPRGGNFLRDQKCLNRARELRLDWLSVGGNKRIHGFAKSFEILLKTTSSASPNFLFGPAERTMKFIWPTISIL